MNLQESRDRIEFQKAWTDFCRKSLPQQKKRAKIIKGWFTDEDGNHIYVDSDGNASYGANAYAAYKSDSRKNSKYSDTAIILSQEQKENLKNIAAKLGCEVGSPMSSDEAASGANFSWTAQQLGAVTLPENPTNAARYAAYNNNNQELKQEIKKFDTVYSETYETLSRQEKKEIDQYSINCPSTVMAYELRARGLDVTAKPVTGRSAPSVFKNLVWKGVKIQQACDGADFLAQTKDDPDTARYGVIVRNDFTRHTLVATREGGKLKIIDTQLGGITYSPNVFQASKYSYSADYKYTPRTEKYKVFSLKDSARTTNGKIFGQMMKEDTTIAFYRLDTLTIDENKIGRYVKVNK